MLPDAIPEAVSANLLRSNAVRILEPALGSLAAAVRFEEEVFRAHSAPGDGHKGRYLECVARFAANLQVRERSLVRAFLRPH